MCERDRGERQTDRQTDRDRDRGILARLKGLMEEGKAWGKQPTVSLVRRAYVRDRL